MNLASVSRKAHSPLKIKLPVTKRAKELDFLDCLPQDLDLEQELDDGLRRNLGFPLTCLKNYIFYISQNSSIKI